MQLLRPREVRFEPDRPLFRASTRPAVVAGLFCFVGALVAFGLAPHAGGPVFSLLALSCALAGFGASWSILPKAVRGYDPANWWLHPGRSELLLRLRPHGSGNEHPGHRSVLRLPYAEIDGIRAVQRDRRAFLDIRLRDCFEGTLRAELRRAACARSKHQRTLQLIADNVLRLRYPGPADTRSLASVMNALAQHVPTRSVQRPVRIR